MVVPYFSLHTNVVEGLKYWWIFTFDFFTSSPWKSVKGSWISRIGRNFDDYPGFQPKITHPKHFYPQCSPHFSDSSSSVLTAIMLTGAKTVKMYCKNSCDKIQRKFDLWTFLSKLYFTYVLQYCYYVQQLLFDTLVECM